MLGCVSRSLASVAFPVPLDGVSQLQDLFWGGYALGEQASLEARVSHAHFSVNEPNANPVRDQPERIGKKASSDCVDEEIGV